MTGYCLRCGRSHKPGECQRDKRCDMCAGAGMVKAAPVHTEHGLSYVAWADALVFDCGCEQ